MTFEYIIIPQIRARMFAALMLAGLILVNMAVCFALKADTTVESKTTLQIAEGDRLFALGRFEAAAAVWTKALTGLTPDRLIRHRVMVLARRAEAYQALGLGQKAQSDLVKSLAKAKTLNDDGLVANLQGSYGNALMLTGALVPAESELRASLKYASANNDFALRAQTLNNLGNVLLLLGRTVEAEATFRTGRDAALRAGNQQLAATTSLNASRVALSNGKVAVAESLAGQAIDGFSRLPDDHAKAMRLVAAGQLVMRIARVSPTSSNRQLAVAYESLRSAEAIAVTIGNDRIASQAHGTLGRMYEDRGRYKEALQLTRKALFRAQMINAPEVLYLWQWQAGRLHRAMGNEDAALKSYRAAVAALRSIRSEFLVKFNRSRSIFPNTVKPVFTELVDLLLKRSGTEEQAGTIVQENLREAQQTMELLKTAELEDYYQDECVKSLQAKVKTIDKLAEGTAAIYPIFLPDRTELLVTLSDRIIRKAVPVPEIEMIATIREFRQKLETRTTNEFLRSAGRLHNWLIRPLEPEFVKRGITTLVVIPSGALRTVPLSPLFDGSKFLIEKYALSVAPGLTLLDPRPFHKQTVAPLLSGLTQSVQGFSALPHVDGELQRIRKMFGGKLFKDKDFVTTSIQQELSERPYSLVHFASHAQFDADATKSFLLTFDGRISMDGLERFVKLSRFRKEPIELLTLSACETATGDDRAALGLAGLAVKAGARSALASLWFVNDKSTSTLISKFYEELKRGNRSKSEALRQAQLTMLKDPRYRHPLYWSAFILIGNWL